MITPEFIHLRVHTAFSLLEGAIKVEKLAHVCAEQQIPAVAMTDSGNIFGAMALTKACKGEGVQPIIGCQLLINSPEQDKKWSCWCKMKKCIKIYCPCSRRITWVRTNNKRRI